MLQEKIKIARLTHELLLFTLAGHPTHVSVDITEFQGGTRITVEARGCTLSDDKITEAQRALASPQRTELESYYGGLVGEEESHACNLRLVAAMVDSGQIERTAQDLRLSIWWHHDTLASSRP